MLWKWQKFDELSTRELYEILNLRQSVFGVEQKCAYLDTDGVDYECWHLCGRENGQLLAYLRVVPAGIKYQEPSIGRVVTSSQGRGKGLGKILMTEALKNIQKELGLTPIRISAQAYLEKFYGDFGFKRIGETYLEDNIPHLEMLLTPS